MKTITISDSLHAALLYFLEELGEMQGNSSCNDSPQELLNLFGPEERADLLKKADLANFNGRPAPEGEESRWPLMDFEFVSILEWEVKKAQ
jgi:hypothetical protein